MKSTLYFLIFISSWSFSQNNIGTINLNIRDSWSRENSFNISIIPDNTELEGTAILTIKFYKFQDEIIKINSKNYIVIKELISNIKYKSTDARGSFCSDGTSITLDFGDLKKTFIIIDCFHLSNNKYKDVTDFIKYIISFTKRINLNTE